jgi:hypothetical protein
MLIVDVFVARRQLCTTLTNTTQIKRIISSESNVLRERERERERESTGPVFASSSANTSCFSFTSSKTACGVSEKDSHFVRIRACECTIEIEDLYNALGLLEVREVQGGP